MVYFWQALFVLLVIETTLFAIAVSEFGFLKTAAALAVSAAAGTFIVSRQGSGAVMGINTALKARQPVAGVAGEAICIVLAGALFIFPGFLSDILAFTLLLPPVQRYISGKFIRVAAPFTAATAARYSPDDGAIEAVYTRVDDQGSDKTSAPQTLLPDDEPKP